VAGTILATADTVARRPDGKVILKFTGTAST
jgi:hypothetical protein